MKQYFQLLIIVNLLSCNASKEYRTDINVKRSPQNIVTTKIDENKDSCYNIINNSKSNFLDITSSGITWQDEFDILPCWISSINSGNVELEDILYNRLVERSKLIQMGEIDYSSTLRITETIFSSIVSSKMLEAAYTYALLDTCIYYNGEGALHIGWVGLSHLLKMTSTEYQSKFETAFIIYLAEKNILDEYNKYSCEYLDVLYREMIWSIMNDYNHDKIPLRQNKLNQNH